MRTRASIRPISLLVLASLLAFASAAVAGNGGRYGYRPYAGYSHARYSHGHYSHHGYPARGYYTGYLPHGYYTSHYYGAPYYYHGGSWYRPYGPRFVVVAPPFGIGISVLPPYYSTVWYGGSPYYYANDTYYTYRRERREYVVTEPPRGEADTSQEESVENFAYPRDGQSEERQSIDRDECHQWAVARAGFDPTRAPANVAQTDMTTNRARYRRAEAACLEARGYTVR